MTRETLLLLQSLLHSQHIVVGAPDDEITAVLTAKQELIQELSKESE